MGVELVPWPMEPVFTRFINMSNDVGRRWVGVRIKPSRSSTMVVCAVSHAGYGAIGIMAVVKEVLSLSMAVGRKGVEE
jgi:hypothetical protein